MIHLKEVATQIAEHLLDIEAIRLSPDEPFTWASGIKSPIYCDNRKSLSYPAIRNYIKRSFLQVLEELYPDTEQVSGVATAGIAHGALLADAADLPFNYVRSKPKGHGMQNLIEGELKPGAKILVVEDLISTGGSSIKAVQALRQEGAEVLGVVAIFDYGFEKAKQAFAEANCPYTTLSDFEHLIAYAEENELFGASQLELMNEWRASMV